MARSLAFAYLLLLLQTGYAQNSSTSGFSPSITSSLPHTSSVSTILASSGFSTSTVPTSTTNPGTRISTTSATAASSVAVPSSTLDAELAAEIETITQRRLSAITGFLVDGANVSSYVSSLGTNGRWPDVDYTTGCAARRANWPASIHWARIVTLSAAYHGGLNAAPLEFVKNAELRQRISLAMKAWFDNDFTNLACLDAGGTSSCPCSDTETHLWNTNWFSNIILVPNLVGQSCLLLNDTLSFAEVGNCTHITSRSYDTFFRSINGVGTLTGANTLDVAKISIDLALLTLNVTVLTDAYRRIHDEVQVVQTVKGDGIRPDGSFGQHSGVLYNGNYGKDYSNDLLDLEIEAAGTRFAAGADDQAAIGILFEGDSWMIYQNTLTEILHWDFSALGRFITFPTADGQPSSSILMNLTKVRQLGELWGSSQILSFADHMSDPGETSNAGDLAGNRMFYNNDYMVHRGENYITSVKMYSTRTQNTECVNTQNPLGFHLSDGTLYTYLSGNEYEDISAAWDWNLIPGTTTDYANTALSCSRTQFTGVEKFVGGVSDGAVGVAAMRYTNPFTKSLSWNKAWFFLPDDTQHVIISNITSASNATILTVLDQRRLDGEIFINSRDVTQLSSTTGIASQLADSLWHGGVGYLLSPTSNSTLFVQSGPKTGSWSAIGTSTQPPITVDLFAAYLQHHSLNESSSYTAFPGTTRRTFQRKRRYLDLQTLQADSHASSIMDHRSRLAMIVFWDATGGTVEAVPSPASGRSRIPPFSLRSNAAVALIYDIQKGVITVADPGQTLGQVNITLTVRERGARLPHCNGNSCNLSFILPQGGLAGSSVSQTLE